MAKNKLEELEEELKYEFAEMMDRLKEIGCEDEADDKEKLMHLWGLYLDSQASLSDALDSIENLRGHQADEMKEVENYVEHIRSLSDERETLTLEFEAENEQLKAEINKLKQSLMGSTTQETTDMLLQQGLTDIAHGSATEQIAFLLVERARLLDELEMDQSRASRTETPAAKTGAVTDEERADFEEELMQQRDMMKRVKAQLEQQHEEEISDLLDEKDKLEEHLNDLQIKLNQIQTAAAAAAPSGEKNSDPIVDQLRDRIEVLDHEKMELSQNIKNLRDENVAHQASAVQLQSHIHDLENFIDNLNYEKQELESKIDLFQELENETPDEQVKVLKAELNEMRELLNSRKDDIEKLEEEKAISETDLKAKIVRLEISLSDTKIQLDREVDERRNLEQRLKQSDLDEGRIRDLETTNEELKKLLSFAASSRARDSQNGASSAETDLEAAANRKELDRLRENLNQVYRENAELQSLLEERQNEMLRIKHVQDSGTSRAEAQLERERGLRADIEARNKVLEIEVNKVLSQLHEKANIIVSLEQQCSQLQIKLDQQSDSISAKDNQLSETNLKLQLAENRVKQLQSELDVIGDQYQVLERQLIDGNALKTELQLSKDEIARLKASIDEQKLQSDAEEQRMIDKQDDDSVQSELEQLKTHERHLLAQNQYLQHSIVELENQNAASQRALKTAQDAQCTCESNKKLLTDKLTYSHRELSRVQHEYSSVQDRFDALLKRYEERKQHHKAKLQKAREIFNREKYKLREYGMKLEQELNLKGITLTKEIELKEKTICDNKLLMKEKRQLMTRLTEEEERWRDKSRTAAMLEVRCRFLEEENVQLQDRVCMINKHKQDAEKALREAQKERHKELLKSWSQSYNSLGNATSSGFGTMTWDSFGSPSATVKNTLNSTIDDRLSRSLDNLDAS
ncbi:uncharacterized protein LOC141908326 isoform X2 [Tubulanus polymorphus]|uniref:uncharacterized protein LOC141908326 isoform X2 n=1 Tax=Tubulanus polymorphus TaxID=672921 RepID=UPI003DA4F348